LEEVVLTKGKADRKVISLPNAGKSALARPVAFVFCERDSGTVQFQVEASLTGKLAVEQAASLLAMHCVVRGQTPCDYTMMIVPQGAMPDAVERRAGELIEAGNAIGSGVDLTSRQREVLRWILQRLSNKEIATRLNLAERTIKFHVSSLLAKFNVSDRYSLIRCSSGLIANGGRGKLQEER
jgi:DNA-binding NarL/FixJ family response regulator